MSNKEEKVQEQELENEMVDEEVKEINKDEYIAKLNDDLMEQKKKTDEYFDHLKRNMAEFDNFKKRINKEKDGLSTMITCDIISNFLPIMDNFEKAIGAETKDKAYKSGMEMIFHQIKEMLSDLGVREIEALNKPFDPTLHEAVMQVEDENAGEKEVVEVLRKGYQLNDKVIRHSMVKVAN